MSRMIGIHVFVLSFLIYCQAVLATSEMPSIQSTEEYIKNNIGISGTYLTSSNEGRMQSYSDVVFLSDAVRIEYELRFLPYDGPSYKAPRYKVRFTIPVLAVGEITSDTSGYDVQENGGAAAGEISFKSQNGLTFTDELIGPERRDKQYVRELTIYVKDPERARKVKNAFKHWLTQVQSEKQKALKEDPFN